MRLPGLNRIGNVGFGAFSRLFALGSQFVVLILLGKLLAKSDFGDFMIVFALTRVLSTGLGTGLATLLVYHIARHATEDREVSLHRTVVCVGMLFASAIAVAMAIFSAQIAGWFDKPTLASWITWMAPFMVFSTLLTISAGALDGRGRITRSILAVEFLPNLIRLLVLPPLLLLQSGHFAIAAVMVVSVALPWFGIASKLVTRPSAGFAPLTAWDLQYVGKLTLHSFGAMQMQGIDMLVVGWLFTSDAAADYAIASRVAALIPFFQTIVVKTFMTRAGSAIHRGDHAALQLEIDRSRSVSTILVTMTAVVALGAYPAFLLMMGKFDGSLPLMAALAISSIVRSYYAGADALLRIAGLVNASLTIMMGSLALLVLVPILSGHWIGVYSLPLGMFVAATTLNPVTSRYVLQRLHVRMAPSLIWVSILVAVVGLAVSVSSGQNLILWFAGIGILASSLVPTLLQYRKLRQSA